MLIKAGPNRSQASAAAALGPSWVRGMPYIFRSWKKSKPVVKYILQACSSASRLKPVLALRRLCYRFVMVLSLSFNGYALRGLLWENPRQECPIA